MMTEIWKLCMHVQKTRLDPAIVPRLTRCHLVVLDIAIAQCGLLTPQAHGSYTHIVLQQMRQRPLFYCNGKCKILGNELDRPSQDLDWVKAAVSAAQRAVKAYSEMVHETIGQSYAEQHLECFDLFTWYTLDRTDPDTFSKNYPGLLTVDQLEQHYQKCCLTMGSLHSCKVSDGSRVSVCVCVCVRGSSMSLSVVSLCCVKTIFHKGQNRGLDFLFRRHG